MSMMDSGIGFANPLSPLHQSLLRSMPNTLNTQGQVGADDQAGMLLRAHNLRAGNPGAGQMTPGSSRGTPAGSGPIGTSLSKYKTLMMSAAGLNADEKNTFKDAAEDPAISPAALKDLLTMHLKNKGAGQHDFEGSGGAAGPAQLPNNGASIGGAAPAGLPQGSIQVTRGHGQNAMSEDAMQQWAARAQGAANSSGEQFMRVQNDQVPRTSFFQKPTGFGAQPGSQYAGRGDITRGPLQGFQVNGIQAPQQAAPQGGQSDPVVGMFQALQQAGADPGALAQWKAFAQAGATPEQLHQAAQHVMAQGHQQRNDDRADQRAQQGMRHTEFSENARVLDELQRQEHALIEANPMLKFGASADPGVMKDLQALRQQQADVRGRLQQSVSPQQQQPQFAQQQPAQGQPAQGQPPKQQQYSLGQVIHTPKGPVMVMGFDKDGHPLIQPGK